MDEAETDPNEMDTKGQRLAYPSGGLYLCQHESVHLLIDALLQVDPKKGVYANRTRGICGCEPAERASSYR